MRLGMRHNGCRRRGVFPRAGLVNTECPGGPFPGPAVAEGGGRDLRQPHAAVPIDLRPVAVPNCACRRFSLSVSAWVWIATLIALVAVLAVDLLIIGRRPHEPSMKESGSWVALYVGLALVFGVGVWIAAGGRYAGEFHWVHDLAIDSQGNLYAGEVDSGKRAQRFVPRR